MNRFFLSNLSWTTLFRLILGLLRLHENEGLKNLDSLILAHNQLSKVPANVFSHLTLLNSLELEGNQITYVDKDAFAGLEGKFLRKSLDWKEEKFISHPQPIHWKFDSVKCFWVLRQPLWGNKKKFNKTNQLKWFKQIFESVKNVDTEREKCTNLRLDIINERKPVYIYEPPRWVEIPFDKVVVFQKGE